MTWKIDYQKKTLKKDKNKLPKVALTTRKYEEEVEVEDELIDYVSPYTIINETGYPIQVETDIVTSNRGVRKHSGSGHLKKRSELHNKIYKIQNTGKAQYLIESNIEDLFNQSMQEVMTGINYIKVKIMHPDFDFITIT